MTLHNSSRSRAASYRELDVWALGMDLVVGVYALTSGFPRDERFGLTAQLRRAAISIPSNVVEGNSRLSVPEYRHAESIARGSLAEVETQLELSQRLGLRRLQPARRSTNLPRASARCSPSCTRA